MAKILFNYKICDRAPACGGVDVCPHHAIYYDEVQKKPVWDSTKCTFCLKCTLPSSCPVGAIMYVANDDQEKQVIDTINSDPRSQDWLWQDRYGVQPGPNAMIINLDDVNFDQIINSLNNKIIDIWHEDTLDCRLHSPLFSDILKNTNFIAYKLDAKKYPHLARKLTVSEFPSLLVFSQAKLIENKVGYLNQNDVNNINQLLINHQ